MWTTGRQEHFSDDKLLSYADGELPARTERAVSQHLQECWACRARLNELEAQAQIVARLMARETFPGPERTERAIQRFLERKNVPLPVPGKARRFLFLRHLSIRWAAVVAALALICSAGVWFWTRYRASELQPRLVLSRIQEFENAIASSKSVIRQVVNVEVRQIRPRKDGLKGGLEVWSDGSTGRYALRWIEQGDTLRYGAWRSAAGQRYVHDPAAPVTPLSAGEGQLKTVSLLDLSTVGVDLKRMEAALLRWIHAQAWRQISVGGDYALFVSQSGVTIRTERGRSAENRLILRLIAARTAGRHRVEFVMEVSPVSYQPHLTALRVEAPEGAVEVHLAFVRSGPVPPGRLEPAVFEPDPAVAGLERKRSRPMLGPRAAESTRAKYSVPDAGELELRWWLHRVGACTKERPEVFRDQRGRIHLRAVAANQDRRQALLAAVMPLQSAFAIDVEIEVQLPPRPRSLPTDSKISSDSLAAVDLAYAEGFALLRLAERYGAAQTAKLDPKSRRLLEGMISDHLAAVRSAGSHAKRLIFPVLAPGGSAEATGTNSLAPAGTNWNEHAFALFRAVDEMDNLVQTLVSGRDVGAGEKSQAEQRLRSVFSTLEDNVQILGWVMARDWRR